MGRVGCALDNAAEAFNSPQRWGTRYLDLSNTGKCIWTEPEALTRK